MPRFSVIIPAHRSQGTIGRTLDALTGQARDAEILVVDSSPDELTWDAVVPFGARVRALRSRAPLLPHAARNLGVAASTGRDLVFTDPDVIPHPDWLEQLGAAASRRPGVAIAGAIECQGDRRVDLGVHLAKFGPWLPSDRTRAIDNGATANLLVPRTLFDELGGFDGDRLHGDTLLTWSLHERGLLEFAPRAIVAHDHEGIGFGMALRERFARGILFADARARRLDRSWVAGLLVATVLPVRWLRVGWLMTARGVRAGWGPRLPVVLPIALACQAASLAGEALGYARICSRPTGRAPDAEA